MILPHREPLAAAIGAIVCVGVLLGAAEPLPRQAVSLVVEW